MRPFDLLPALLDGVWITVQLTAGGAAVAFCAAWIAGLAKLSPWWPLRWIAIAYIEIFRGTSALVQLFWFYFALPLLGVEFSAMITGILVLGLNIGSYGAEVVRSTVQGIPRGQREAATALNLSGFQLYRYILIPQAAVTMLPPAGNLLVELLKGTALVSLITLSDLTFQGQILRAETLRTVEIFGLLLAMYFILALIMTRGIRRLERRLGRYRQAGTAHGI
jgi:polar amino acid transport system permease protein